MHPSKSMKFACSLIACRSATLHEEKRGGTVVLLDFWLWLAMLQSHRIAVDQRGVGSRVKT